MPFGVSQWPYSPDPRQPDFDLIGWNFGQVPPWKWTVKTQDATGLAEIFNGGVLVEPAQVLPGQVVFIAVDALPDDVTIEVKHSGFLEPVGPPPVGTMFITIVIRQDGSPEFTGVLTQTYPEAIVVQTPIIMAKVGIGVGTMPEPCETIPEIWDAEPA